MIFTYIRRNQYLKRKGLTYKQYLKSKHWNKISTKYKTKFPICEVCKKSKSTQVHHNHYENIGKEKYWDLIAICNDCHKTKHNL